MIGDYEAMYTAPEDQQMPSQTVEFVGAKSPAHEDHEMASQMVDNAAMKTPMV